MSEDLEVKRKTKISTRVSLQDKFTLVKIEREIHAIMDDFGGITFNILIFSFANRFLFVFW